MLRIRLLKLLPLSALLLSLSGCGLTQSVSEGTSSLVNTLFYKKITVLHLDFTAGKALNSDVRTSNSPAGPVVIRVYQLKDNKLFDKMHFQQLLKEGNAQLAADLLASQDVVLKPGGAALLDMPMEPGTKYIGVVGLFRQPDEVKNNWKLTITQEALDPNKARVIEANNNHLTLLALQEK